MDIELRQIDPITHPLDDMPAAIAASEYEQRMDATYAACGCEWVLVYADREHYANLVWLTNLDPRFEEALLVLGPERLPEVARIIGRIYGQLRRASEEFQNTIRQDISLIERQEEIQKHRAVAEEIRERFAVLVGVQTHITESTDNG